MKIYLVGGAVRDSLLGLDKADRDWVVVGATVPTMLDQGYLQVGKDFPVFLHPQSKEEYALARTERKQGRGHTGFVVNADPGVTLEEDLQRRDLTINAIAQDTDGAIVDPYGGCQDIKNRILRHVSPAFAEDPLRVLRVARFAARFSSLGFRIAEETKKLMNHVVRSGELEHLPAERIWQELHKALCEGAPDVFVHVLYKCGALRVILPEVEKLFGVPQPEQYHPEIDTGVHVLMSLVQACLLSDDPVVRYAVLVHDVGKGVTPAEQWPHHYRHEQMGVALIDAIGKRLRVPLEFTKVATLVSRHHTQCHQLLQARPVTILKLLEAVDAFRRPQHLEQFLLACEADARGRTGFEEQGYPQADLLRRAFDAAQQLNITELLQSRKLLPVQNESAAESPEEKRDANLRIRDLIHQQRTLAIRSLLQEEIQ